ncbi:MAG: 23S rRNA (uracil(1939)-C(5))-methyltransferase RlmD [Oscillospiraceae bacterium]|nr:23S rRNA (uracil(1939)-C(5))-methyltransferase RlmD [Oscillospiraceae bacterium]
MPEILVTVTGYAADGSGVARLPDGRVAFIPGAAREDVVEINIIKKRPRSCRAEITRILQPSPHRAEPDCPVYPACGGCDFRHITYEEELRAKLARINDALERIAKVSVRADEILTTGQINGYRNKAVFHSEERDGKAVTGFYRPKSHIVVPVDRCLLMRDKPRGAEELDGLTFQVSEGSFFQVSTGAALLLCQKAREYAALTKEETLLDLYCGVGLFTLFLGRDAKNALGVENNPAAVADARENARVNGFSHVQFLCADADEWDAGDFHPDCVVADPPRKGLSGEAVNKILELSPKKLIYISCDPATLARDIKLLEGYTARSVTAVDMFPRTAHVECCCLLTK